MEKGKRVVTPDQRDWERTREMWFSGSSVAIVTIRIEDEKEEGEVGKGKLCSERLNDY